LKLLATLLTDEKCTIDNVPRLRDIDTAVALLEYLGKSVQRNKNSVEVSKGRINRKHAHIAPYDLIKKMRASFLVAGPLLAKYHKAEVSLPGGCAIGLRPVDIHVEGFRELGAKVKVRKGYVILSAAKLKIARPFIEIFLSLQISS